MFILLRHPSFANLAQCHIYALRPKVYQEYHLVAEGVFEPVKLPEWAAPIIPVHKRDKETIRICGDFKQSQIQKLTVTHYQKQRIYLPPWPEERFSQNWT